MEEFVRIFENDKLVFLLQHVHTCSIIALNDNKRKSNWV